MEFAFSLQMAGITDPGLVRSHNEDYILWDESHGLALLADGLGGHNAGEVASRLCLHNLRDKIITALDKGLWQKANKGMTREATVMRRAILQVNRMIYGAAQDNSEYQGMGTTLAAMLFYQRNAVVAHVGDSRVYRLRGQQLEQLTSDHSVVQEMFEQGRINEQQLEESSQGHLITRAIGVESKVSPEVQEFAVQGGDLYLLCSDGLSDLVDDQAIYKALMKAGNRLGSAMDTLLRLAKQQGGSDNISVLLVAVNG